MLTSSSTSAMTPSSQPLRSPLHLRALPDSLRHPSRHRLEDHRIGWDQDAAHVHVYVRDRLQILPAEAALEIAELVHGVALILVRSARDTGRRLVEQAALI